jgi:hypothetical protein
VVDRERILAKLDELDGYLGELRSVVPESIEEYQTIEKRRSCERLRQVSVITPGPACSMSTLSMMEAAPVTAWAQTALSSAVRRPTPRTWIEPGYGGASARVSRGARF